MADVVASAATPVSSVFFESTRQGFDSQEVKSLSDLPEDVLLEVYTCMDFFEIIALRQTCRKCYRVSKSTALWLDAHRWITEGAEDWRVSLANHRLPLSADDLERTVARLVNFERNWSRGSPGIRSVTSFSCPPGFASALVPGGRWFLSSVLIETPGVMSYDLDDLNIEGRMLIRLEHQDHVIGALDFFSDSNFTGSEFDLAVLSISSEVLINPNFTEPQIINIWKTYVDENNHLAANLTRSLSVFPLTPPAKPISLSRNSLLRLSSTSSGLPMFSVHRWGSLGDDSVTHSVLIPRRREMPQKGVRLLPDGRIVSISHRWVEIYAPPSHPWEASPVISEDTPRSSPLWVFEYSPPFDVLHHVVSRTLHAPAGDWVKFWIHNGETIFSVRIPLGTDLEPDVSSKSFGLEQTSTFSLGTSRTITHRLQEKEVIFNTLDYLPRMRRLLGFAGVLKTRRTHQSKPLPETRFLSPRPSSKRPWILDEESGRVLYVLAANTPVAEYVVLNFID